MASCHRAMVERTKGRRPKNRPSDTKGRRPRNRPAKGGTLEATWMRGEGTPEPWRRGATYFLQVVAATACASVTSSKPTPLGMGCLWLASGTGLLGPTSLYALRTSWTMPAVRAPSNSEKLNERFRVCEEQTRTCATARRPECQQASAPRNPTLPCLFSQAAGVTFQLPREGRRACLSVVCSLLLFSLLSFFCACFEGVFLEQGVRGSHSGHPRG